MKQPKFYPGQVVYFVHTNKVAHEETVVGLIKAIKYDHVSEVWGYQVGDWMPDFRESDLAEFGDLVFEKEGI